MYLNCKQNAHRKQDLRKLRRVINKICPIDPETNFKHKKRTVQERIDRNLLGMGEEEFNRLQTILNLYAKLDAFPPSLKNFDKWLESNQRRQQQLLEKEELMRRHVESLPKTRIRNRQREEKAREDRRVQVSLSNTQKLENDYFLSPKILRSGGEERKVAVVDNNTFTRTEEENIQ